MQTVWIFLFFPDYFHYWKRAAMESTVSVIFLVSFSILLCESYHHGVETATVVHTSERAFPEKTVGVNTDLAGLIQKLHLQELFNRYGENNSLSIDGFRKLLQNIGIDKMKRIKISHDHDHHDHDHNHDHHDHDHDHHSHHNHVSLSKGSEKAACPSHESDGSKEHRSSHAKEPHKAESVERQQNFVRSKNTVHEITASVIAASTGSHADLQGLQPGEVRTVVRVPAGPGALNATGLGASKANESRTSPKEVERGSYLYSKLKKQNTQEVRLILLCSQIQQECCHGLFFRCLLFTWVQVLWCNNTHSQTHANRFPWNLTFWGNMVLCSQAQRNIKYKYTLSLMHLWFIYLNVTKY